MTALTDRITAVLRDHQPVATWDVRDSFWCQGCQQSYPDDAFAAHVAERIAEALQLTEEWSIQFTVGNRTSRGIYTTKPKGWRGRLENRWVSAWSEVQRVTRLPLAPPLPHGHPVHAEGSRDVDLSTPGSERG